MLRFVSQRLLADSPSLPYSGRRMRPCWNRTARLGLASLALPSLALPLVREAARSNICCSGKTGLGNLPRAPARFPYRSGRVDATPRLVRRAGPNVSEAVWAAVYRESRSAYLPL